MYISMSVTNEEWRGQQSRNAEAQSKDLRARRRQADCEQKRAACQKANKAWQSQANPHILPFAGFDI